MHLIQLRWYIHKSHDTKYLAIIYRFFCTDDTGKTEDHNFITLCQVSSSIHKEHFYTKSKIVYKLSFHVYQTPIGLGMRVASMHFLLYVY